jgi:uncharacterized protein (TIGR02217 family)
MSDAVFPIGFLAYGFSGGTEYQTTIVVTYGGHEQRNADWPTPRRRWLVPLSHMTDAERDSLIAFVDARLGAFDNFLFDDPHTATQYRVRFARDYGNIRTEYFEGHFWPDLEIVEVRDSGP